MGEVFYAPDGTVLPSDTYRSVFLEDLHETIFKQIFKERKIVRGKIDDKLLACKLPKGSQLLDFVTIRGTERYDEFEISLAIPSAEDDELGFIANFRYVPPR